MKSLAIFTAFLSTLFLSAVAFGDSSQGSGAKMPLAGEQAAYPELLRSAEEIAEQDEANRAWEAESYQRTDSCNADFIPTWTMGSSNLHGCHYNPFGKATEGSSD